MKNYFSFLVLILLIAGMETDAQKLSPGDGVKIIFLDITDQISGDYSIQPDGNLQLPFIGIISTSNKAFTVIKKEIYEKYDSLYKNPELNVLALYRINILGEVNSPGYYYTTEDQKLTGILALAGGLTSDANLDNVYIIRNDREVELDVETIMREGDTASDFGLQSGDQIYVPRSFWSDTGRFTWIFSAITAVVAVAVIFLNN